MPKYNIRVQSPENQQTELAIVEGSPVSLPELEGISLFIHHPLNIARFWNISEYKTGTSLIEYCDGTRKQAVDALRNGLAGLQVPDIKALVVKAIYEHVAKYGIANKE